MKRALVLSVVLAALTAACAPVIPRPVRPGPTPHTVVVTEATPRSRATFDRFAAARKPAAVSHAGQRRFGAAVLPSPQSGVALLDSPGASVDSAAMLNGAAARANARGGGKLELGGGTFRIKSTFLLNGYQNVEVEGQGAATVILIDDSLGNIGDGILLKNTAGCAIRHMIVQGASARTSGAHIRVRGGVSGYLDKPRTTIQDVFLDQVFDGVVVDRDQVGDHANFKTYIIDVDVARVSAGGTGMKIDTAPSFPSQTGASQFIINPWIYDPDDNGLAGIRLASSGDATVVNGEVYGFNTALLMDPGAGAMLTSVTVIGGFYDRSVTNNLLISPNASVGIFGAIRFNEVWFAGASGGQNIVLSGARDVEFHGGTVYSAEGLTTGYCAQVHASTHIKFLGTNFAGCRTAGAYFSGSSSYFTLQDSTFWAGLGTSLSGMPLAVKVDAGSDNYSITGNDWSDSTVTTKITNTPGTSATRIVDLNR